MSQLAPLLPLLAVAVLFWVMLIRPQQRRQRAVNTLQDSLRVGQRVMLTSGVFGTITSLTDDRVHMEVAPGVQLEVMRAAVGQVDEPTTGATGEEVDGA